MAVEHDQMVHLELSGIHMKLSTCESQGVRPFVLSFLFTTSLDHLLLISSTIFRFFDFAYGVDICVHDYLRECYLRAVLLLFSEL